MEHKEQNSMLSAEGMSRRSFLRTSGLFAGGMGAFALAGCSPKVEPTPADNTPAGEGEATPTVKERVTEELPIPAASAAPETTAYDCDVLVVGGGYAGINAAMAAVAAGSSVVLVDKGRPGYSGLSPWPSSHRWFDAEMGDVAEDYRKAIQIGGEYVVNLDWYQQWIDHSKEAYERLCDWGLMDRYDRCADTEYWEKLDYPGYREAFAGQDRHAKVVPLLKNNGITVVDFTMITNVEVEDNHVVGAVGLHVPSGAIININAKAIVMASGGGCYKPTGYPVGGNTFDGEYIGYQLGLPITGKEYEDFHETACSWAPGNAFICNSWDWLENLWLCGGDITAKNAATYGPGKFKAMVLGRITGSLNGISSQTEPNIEDQANGTAARRGGSVSENPDDVRTGKKVSPKPKGDQFGVAVGMCLHMASGVFCGIDDVEGKTSIDGLWYAGDGANASGATGAMYPVGVGFTSNYASIQGDIAGKAAAAFAATAAAPKISADRLAAITEEINAPLSVETGFSPDWARDQLYGIMAPYWVTGAKREETLKAALAQVEYMRDNVVPKLAALNSHQLRLAIEMKHKVLSAEMKLRAGLERKESRGVHYREDYPYRDDNYLCYITLQKGADGSMQVGRVNLKDEWKGDLTEDYATRYSARFPLEAKAKGIVEESSSTGGWGK